MNLIRFIRSYSQEDICYLTKEEADEYLTYLLNKDIYIVDVYNFKLLCANFNYYDQYYPDPFSDEDYDDAGFINGDVPVYLSNDVVRVDVLGIDSYCGGYYHIPQFKIFLSEDKANIYLEKLLKIINIKDILE